MTHTKHTPGPWHIGTNGDSIDAANLDKICDIPRYVTNPNRVADAALIAAAPDMLEALKSIIEWHDDEHDWPVNGDREERENWYERRLLMIRNAARAAIAKARGNDATTKQDEELSHTPGCPIGLPCAACDK
jgi:hypothetical protein